MVDLDDDLLVVEERDEGADAGDRFDLGVDANDLSSGLELERSTEPEPEPQEEPEPETPFDPGDVVADGATEPDAPVDQQRLRSSDKSSADLGSDANDKVPEGVSPAHIGASVSTQDALPPGGPAPAGLNEDKAKLQDTTRKKPKGRSPDAPGAGVGKRGPKEQASGGPHSKGHSKALAEQLLANIAFNAPEKVPYGEPSYIQFVLDPNLDKTEIVKKIREKGHKVTARIKITRTMEVTLTGEEFQITPIAEEEQMIALDDTTEWKWSILPKEPGKHRVHLVVNAIIRVDGVEMKRSKSFDRTIEIEVTGIQQTVIFMQENWPWLALGFVPLVFLGPVRSSMPRRPR